MFGILFVISLAILLVLPAGAGVMAVVIMAVSSFAVYGMRGMYYAIIGEAGTPKSIYGTVAGLAMFIGFSPDFFNPTLIGSWLDKYPGAPGYQMVFAYMLGTMVVGLVFVVLLMRHNKKNAGKLQAEQDAAQT